MFGLLLDLLTLFALRRQALRRNRVFDLGKERGLLTNSKAAPALCAEFSAPDGVAVGFAVPAKIA